MLDILFLYFQIELSLPYFISYEALWIICVTLLSGFTVKIALAKDKRKKENDLQYAVSLADSVQALVLKVFLFFFFNLH